MTRTIRALAALTVLAVAACSSDTGTATTTAPVVSVPPGAAGTTPTTGATGETRATATPAVSPPDASTTQSATGSGAPATAAPTSAGAAPTSAVAAVTAPVDAVPAASLEEFATVEQPVAIALRPGDDRLFVITQNGTVVPVAPDGTVGAEVLDITDRTEAQGERGLLGLAFHPSEPLAYVHYSAADSGDTRIDEFRVAADGTFDPSSRRAVLAIDQPHPNHNGGQLAFGPDSLLYIGMGDGGSQGDPKRRAMDTGDLLGKILRIDPRANGDRPYTSPADNPFVGVDGAKPEIWSIGLRNPFSFSFDPATGDLWIADVGQDKWEEIDVAWAADGGGRGQNFGWSAFEGTHRYNDDQPTTGAVAPIHEYEHGGLGCSISGGARYRGAAITSLQGWYVYGDYCSGQVRALQILGREAGREVELGSPGAVSSVTAGPDGELFVTSLSNDEVYRITA